MSLTASDIARAAKGKRSGVGWLIQCPAPGHRDQHPSCTVTDGPNGPIFHCFAGCDWREIRAAAEAKGWIEPFSSRTVTSLCDRQTLANQRDIVAAEVALQLAKLAANRGAP